MNVRHVVLVPLVIVALIGVPLTGFVLDDHLEPVSADRADDRADDRAQRTPDAADSQDDGPGKKKARDREKHDKAADKAAKVAEKAAAKTAHAEEMRAWARCVAEAVATPGPDKPKPWRACPHKPLGPGRAAHDKDKPTPPGHDQQAQKSAKGGGR